MYLGIDLGTSGLKAVLMDHQQTIIAASHSEISTSRPNTGWVEQDPNEWIIALENALDGLSESHQQQLSDVCSIGLSGHMHGAVLLDRAGKILRPCIMWNDTRSFHQAGFLDDNPIFREQSGNIVFPGFTAPKLLWVEQNEPEIFDKIFKVLLPKDFIRFWLSGDLVSEMSDSAGTSWLDTGARRFSPELLDAGHMREDQMPTLIEGSEISGTLKEELATRFAMKKDVVIAGGAGDNAASAIGMGIIKAGSGFLSLGTSGVLFVANNAYLPNPDSAVHTFCHCLPDRWHQMGVILSATDSLNWFASITGLRPDALINELGDTPSGPGQLQFLPYLSGERTPHNDAHIRGAINNISHNSDRASITRGILEGVAFAFKDSAEALKSTGTRLERLWAVGGGAKSHYWLQLISNVLNVEIDVAKDGDFGAAFGAARLGMIARESADPESVCSFPEIAKTITPQSAFHDDYHSAYQKYRALYPPLKHLSSRSVT